MNTGPRIGSLANHLFHRLLWGGSASLLSGECARLASRIAEMLQRHSLCGARGQLVQQIADMVASSPFPSGDVDVAPFTSPLERLDIHSMPASSGAVNSVDGSAFSVPRMLSPGCEMADGGLCLELMSGGRFIRAPSGRPYLVWSRASIFGKVRHRIACSRHPLLIPPLLGKIKKKPKTQ